MLFGLVLKIAVGVAVGVSYALLAIYTSASNWIGILAWFFAMAFGSVYMSFFDKEWKIALFMGGALMFILLAKMQYMEFAQQGRVGAEVRGEVSLPFPSPLPSPPLLLFPHSPPH